MQMICDKTKTHTRVHVICSNNIHRRYCVIHMLPHQLIVHMMPVINVNTCKYIVNVNDVIVTVNCLQFPGLGLETHSPEYYLFLKVYNFCNICIRLYVDFPLCYGQAIKYTCHVHVYAARQ